MMRPEHIPTANMCGLVNSLAQAGLLSPRPRSSSRLYLADGFDQNGLPLVMVRPPSPSKLAHAAARALRREEQMKALSDPVADRMLIADTLGLPLEPTQLLGLAHVDSDGEEHLNPGLLLGMDPMDPRLPAYLPTPEELASRDAVPKRHLPAPKGYAHLPHASSSSPVAELTSGDAASPTLLDK